MIKKIGIIGLGNVGQATVRSLKKYSSLIAHRTSLKIEIKGLCDARRSKSKFAKINLLPFTKDAYQLINDPAIDTIVELVGGINPAKQFIIDALKKGKNVVTANKALLAQHGRELFALAEKKKRMIGFEASVCGAIPLIKSISQGLVSCEVGEIYGILNGTTNYILYKMGKDKVDFSRALSEAQDKGIAERNPSLDINGVDTLHKLCLLSYLCFGVWPSPEKVYTRGIKDISLLDILYAEELNYRIKLLAIAKKRGKRLEVRVHPTLVSMDHPISEVSSSYNAVSLDTQPAGKLLFYGLGAGGGPTSSSVISDIVSISLHAESYLRQEEKVIFLKPENIRTRYYIRFMALDKPGVLAQVSRILAAFGISIASVTQKERMKRKFVPIVMITHEAKERDMRRALAKIDNLTSIKSPSQLIRIENL
ncbi:MAG: homoserine dehydrogenase [Candidatus Omnitrophica bacterium]|nr:homoserine dehydrogenase [Candidatus Omnitrophota bacterium]